MTLSVDDCTRFISHYSSVFAEAARDNLAGDVEHCPEWDVADLVRHLTEVHWFWSTIAEHRLSGPPEESSRPARPGGEALVATFEAGAAHLVEVLAAADQSASCWTWFPDEQNVAFITRHQVQEAIVHTWDAVNAAGGSLDIDPVAAADSVDEFLTTSLVEDDDARERTFTPLDGTLVLRATDTGDTWTLTDGTVPGAVVMSHGAAEGAPVVEATAADLLLWIYRRRDLPVGAAAELAARFSALTSTD
ncbi:MAG: maleylpyruvate isomerase family mycothiol-dependent enzyme [Nocardioides sp.]